MIRGLSAADILRSRGVLSGLGTPAEKKSAQDNIENSIQLRRKIEPLLKKHTAALKAVNPWWVENFTKKGDELYNIRRNVDEKSDSDWTGWTDYVKGTAADLVAYQGLLKQLEAIDAAARPASPPPAARPPASGSATTAEQPPAEQTTEGGKSNTMMYVGLGVAALLIFMAFSEE
jgi:hypothetical protein